MRTPALRIDTNLRFRLALGLAGVAVLFAPLVARSGEHRTTTTRSSSNGFDFTSSDDSHFGWSIYEPGYGNTTGDTGSDDWDALGRDLANEKSTVFWFKLDGARYVVRDPEIVARVEEITRPMREVGKKQGELGARQGALGAQQGKLGAEQGRLGLRQAMISQKLARLAADEARDGTSHRAERRALERELDEISDRMSVLGEQQGELGAKQGPLGERQGDLGRRQGELSQKASVDLRKVAEEALRDGKAQKLGVTRRRGTL